MRHWFTLLSVSVCLSLAACSSGDEESSSALNGAIEATGDSGSGAGGIVEQDGTSGDSEADAAGVDDTAALEAGAARMGAWLNSL